jgi:hypothetical protein
MPLPPPPRLKKTKEDPLQTEAFGMAERFAVDPQTLAVVEEIRAGTPAFAPDPRVRERYYNEAVVAPAMRQYRESIVPTIATYFAARNANRGGGFQAALTRSAEDFGTNLAGIRAGLLSEDETRRFQSTEAAAARRPLGVSLAIGNQLLPMQVKAAMGAERRGITAQNNMARWANAMGAWQAQQAQALMDSINRLASIGPFEVGPSPSSGGGWRGVLGGALSGAMLGAPFGPIGLGIGALGGGIAGYL